MTTHVTSHSTRTATVQTVRLPFPLGCGNTGSPQAGSKEMGEDRSPCPPAGSTVPAQPAPLYSVLGPPRRPCRLSPVPGGVTDPRRPRQAGRDGGSRSDSAPSWPPAAPTCTRSHALGVRLRGAVTPSRASRLPGLPRTSPEELQLREERP